MATNPMRADRDMRKSRPIIRALCVLTVALLALALPARAEVTITQAEYAAGVLVVRGETSQANQRVTLDGRYDTRTGPNKQFRFRIRYRPRDCVVDIRAGREVHPATITNCQAAAGASSPVPQLRSPAAVPSTSGAGPQDAYRIQVIQQRCELDKDCMVVCPEGAFAINAFCPGGDARLMGERSVACPAGRDRIVAYCAAPQ
jgi:hypothetical protein